MAHPGPSSAPAGTAAGPQAGTSWWRGAIGRPPRWRPRGLVDRLVVALYTALYVWLRLPLWLLTRLLGWTKLDWVALDLLSIPGSLLRVMGRLFGDAGRRWGLKMNAVEHTHLVCRMCPAARRALRDPSGGGVCVWNTTWNRGRFDIPPHFGPRNARLQYLGRTELADYQSLHAGLRELPPADAGSAWFRPPGWFVWPASLVVNLLLVTHLASPLSVGGLVGFLLPAATAAVGHDWVDVGAVPAADLRYPPQGMTVVDGRHLLLNNHWKDAASHLYVLDPADVSVRCDAPLPEEAKHIAGLTWAHELLWTLDYGAGWLHAFQFQIAPGGCTLTQSDRYPTGLRGASGLTHLAVDGVDYLAMSDFMHTSRSYVVPMARLGELRGGAAVPELAVTSWPHGGFSQGLTWDGTFVYDATGARGRDRILVVDAARAIREGVPAIEPLGAFPAPADMVEDLAILNGALWTSDEATFRVYRCDRLPEVREHFLELAREKR